MRPLRTELRRTRIAEFILVCLCFCVLTGCQQKNAEVSALSDDDAMLDELLGDLDSGNQPAKVPEADLSETDPAEQAFPEPAVSLNGPLSIPQPERSSLSPVKAASSAGAPIRTATHQQLKLKLERGDQFALVKTVRQNLVQKSSHYPATASTQLELHMQIQVADQKPDAVLLNVQYVRVRYFHDVNGDTASFDSAAGAPAPENMLPYAGMVNNGFSFWLDADHRIQQMQGYEEFLQRCVQLVPEQRRQTLLTELAGKFGDDGVANFVDDTIGLLPAGNDVPSTGIQVGDVWYRERKLEYPTPVRMKSSCRLLALTADRAEIDITGTIDSGNQAPEMTRVGGPEILLRGGRTMGSCTIDRASGLPLSLNRSRYLTMQITTADGVMVDQEKQIETSLQSTPVSRGAVAATAATGVPSQMRTASSNGLVPASGASPRPQMSANPLNSAPQSHQLIQPPPYRNGIRQVSGQARNGTAAEPNFNVDPSQLQSQVQAVYPQE
ncbi:MAG: DUF6263 family protein [Planctomycetaceae bacterium]